MIHCFDIEGGVESGIFISRDKRVSAPCKILFRIYNLVGWLVGPPSFLLTMLTTTSLAFLSTDTNQLALQSNMSSSSLTRCHPRETTNTLDFELLVNPHHCILKWHFISLANNRDSVVTNRLRNLRTFSADFLRLKSRVRRLFHF